VGREMPFQRGKGSGEIYQSFEEDDMKKIIFFD
jgi:hypothetical protein